MTNNDKIKCPKCGFDIPVSEVLQHRLTEQIDNEVAKKINTEKEKLENDFLIRLEKERNDSTKTLKQRLAIESKKREEAEQKELEFIKKQTDLEDKIKHQELDIARKIQDERKIIQEKTEKELEEKYNLKDAERQKQLDDTKKALAEAQRKAAQGSMQTQGEVMELALEELLKQKFTHDEISPVPKGITGADITEKIYSDSGVLCGIIAWESKKTKAWTDEWVQKLKDDSRNIRANISVLVSEALPKEINNFGLYKGVWVCNFSSVLGLATALRHQLISTAKIISSQENKDEKKDVLYNYLSGQTFASRVETIAENFMSMKNNLEKEKIAFNKIWAVRETQINRMLENTAKMYGEISGITGQALPGVELLGLESIAGELEEPKKKIEKESSDNSQTELF